MQLKALTIVALVCLGMPLKAAGQDQYVKKAEFDQLAKTLAKIEARLAVLERERASKWQPVTVRSMLPQSKSVVVNPANVATGVSILKFFGPPNFPKAYLGQLEGRISNAFKPPWIKVVALCTSV